MAFADTLYGANESEKALIAESLQPQKPATKKAGKKASKRVPGLGDAIKGSRQRTPNGAGDEEEIDQCLFVLSDATGETCNAVKDDPIHDLTYISSHGFLRAAAAVKPASGD